MLKDVHLLDGRVDKLQKHFALGTTDISQIRTSTDKITRRSQKILEVELDEGGAGADPLDPPNPGQPPEIS